MRLSREADATREFAALVGADGASAPQANPYQQAPAGPELEQFARTLKPEEMEFFSLGRLLLRHHLPDAAARVFSVGTQVLSQAAVLQYGLGWSLLEAGRLEEAPVHLRRALELKPDYLECCLRLGFAYFTVSEIDLATETYGRCIRIDPQNYAAHYFLGTVLLKAKPPSLVKTNLRQTRYSGAPYNLPQKSGR